MKGFLDSAMHLYTGYLPILLMKTMPEEAVFVCRKGELGSTM